MRAKGANVIDHGDGGGHLGPDQNAVIEDTADSGDGASAQSTGKMDPQALGWTKRYFLIFVWNFRCSISKY